MIRIPEWISSYKINMKTAVKEVQYLAVSIEQSTEIEIEFISEIVMHTLTEGIYYSKGSLVYSLGMKGERTERITPPEH